MQRKERIQSQKNGHSKIEQKKKKKKEQENQQQVCSIIESNIY